jgi:predicted secreted hydrolase
LRIVIVPELADQENRSYLVKNLFYWEGAVRIETAEGSGIGRGYVELVGYGTRSRPAI